MRVLFAVVDEKISNAVIDRYQKEYNSDITYKNVYFFNAVVKELERDQNYDAIVIDELLETVATDDSDVRLLGSLQTISEVAINANNTRIPIILILKAKRQYGEGFLTKIYSFGILNALIGKERKISKICELLAKPRTKSEAQEYYQISVKDDFKQNNEEVVPANELQNIINYYRRNLGAPETFSSIFDKIKLQYSDYELLYILDNLDDKVIEVLSKENQKYSELITNKENILANNKQEKKENVETRTENNILVLNNKKEEEKIISEPNKKVPETNEVLEKEVKENDFKTNEVSLNNEELKEDNRGDLNSNNLKFDEPKVLEETKIENKIEENKKEDNENIDNKVQEINIDIDNNQEEVKKENLEDLNKENIETSIDEKNEDEDIETKLELEDEKKENIESNEQVISISPKKLETIKAENVEIVQPIKVEPKQLEEINFTANEEKDYSNNINDNRAINNPIEDVYMNNMLNQFKNTRCAIFVGTSKNGISFTVNSLGMLFSSIGINTAILDLTKNRNDYYIATSNEEDLRNIAMETIHNLRNGVANGIQVERNLTVYTAMPTDSDSFDDAENIMQTLYKNHSLILIDADFDTPHEYFKLANQIFAIQSLDVLTIQPLTQFMRDLKRKNILNDDKIRVIINKELPVKGLSKKLIVEGLSTYNSPSMSSIEKLFDRNTVRVFSIEFDMNVYQKYMENIAYCKFELIGYPRKTIEQLKIIASDIVPHIN